MDEAKTQAVMILRPWVLLLLVYEHGQGSDGNWDDLFRLSRRIFLGLVLYVEGR